MGTFPFAIRKRKGNLLPRAPCWLVFRQELQPDSPKVQVFNQLHQQKQHEPGRASQRFLGMWDSLAGGSPQKESLSGACVLHEELTLPEHNLH